MGGSRTRVIPNVDEQLPISLDFVFNWDIDIRGGDYTLGFKVQNILGEAYEASQTFDGTTVLLDTYDIGRTFAASVKRRF